MKLLRRLIIFIKKEERKAVSLLKIVLKTAFALFVVAIIPILYFLILISIEPRSFPEINNYIQDKVLRSSESSIDLNTKDATLSFDISSLNIIYNIKNFSKNNALFTCKTTDDDKFTSQPKFAVEINPFKLLIGMLKIENITISDICINLINFQNSTDNEQIQNNLQKLHTTISTLHEGRFSIKTFKLKNIVLKSSNNSMLHVNSAYFNTQT